MSGRVFPLNVAWFLTVGLLAGCNPNSEDTKSNYSAQAEQTIDKQ